MEQQHHQQSTYQIQQIRKEPDHIDDTIMVTTSRIQIISLALLLLGGVRVVSGIIGGSVADPTNYPYFTRLEVVRSKSETKSPGGTLIAPDVVLTYAYRFAEYGDGDKVVKIKAWVNKSSIEASEYEYERSVGFWLVHPDFTADSFDNDIALVFLDEPVMDVPLVKINRDTAIPEVGQSFTEIGFGITNDQPWDWPKKLMEVTVDTVSFENCQEASDPTPIFEDHQFCAGSERQGHCFGDSGGPLLHLSHGTHHAAPDKDVQVGIILYNTIETALMDTDDEQCLMPGYPGGFTKVAPYAEWIDSSIRMYSRYSKGKRSKKSHTDSRKGSMKGRTRNRQL